MTCILAESLRRVFFKRKTFKRKTFNRETFNRKHAATGGEVSQCESSRLVGARKLQESQIYL